MMQFTGCNSFTIVYGHSQEDSRHLFKPGTLLKTVSPTFKFERAVSSAANLVLATLELTCDFTMELWHAALALSS